jgi:hypothetical protein
LIFKANLFNANTAQEKGKLLTDHISTHTGHHRQQSVTCDTVAVFCDESLLSGPPDSDGLISTASELQGYVQTKTSMPISTMKKRIDSSSWKSVPGGLTGDDEFL